MSELKKCPGCNGEAKFNEQFNGCIPNISKTVFYSCECGWCGPAATGKCETKEDLFKLAERAAAAWNRRAQPENDPLTLDELRQMDGEPVWVQELPPYTTAGYKVLAAPAVNEYGDICFDGGDCYAPYDYGKTWLAYRRKPERSEG